DALIPALHAEIAKLEKELADPALYSRDPKAFNAKSERVGAARAEAEAAEMEWLDIEERREALAT
ncbi:MAG: ABC transporter ATP-binding protein, partial [Alphaproteobacteria bacterium]|nr:ABC transporter ATP-binding protein [Alphaproteobacteria bacterium]